MTAIRKTIKELEEIKNDFDSYSDENLYTKLKEVYTAYKNIIKKGPYDTYNYRDSIHDDSPIEYDRKELKSYFNIYITSLSNEADIRERQTVPSPATVINNTNTNNNSTNIMIQITFEKAKEQISKSYNLDDDEKNDLIKKIFELEKIVNSKDKKATRWENAKEIMKYIIDKGIDAGIALLPFLTKLFQTKVS